MATTPQKVQVITWRNVYTGRTATLCDAHRESIGDAQVEYGAHAGRCQECAYPAPPPRAFVTA